MSDDGFVVYKGSKCNLEETPTLGKYVVNSRAKLIENGVLEEENGVLVFKTDHIFNSPSTAAATVLARSSNGWTEWKDKSGKTLDELKRK